jgi:hypothetical protein
MKTGKRKVAQVQVQPSTFSEAAADMAVRRFRPASVQSEFIATRVPINYYWRLIFNREQILESPSLAGLVEARCGRAS